MNRNALIVSVLCAMLVSVVAAPALRAQRNPMERPQDGDSLVSITLVLVSHGAAPTLIRRASSDRSNVILLDSATTNSQTLSDAVFSLLILEAMDRQGQQRNDHAAQRATLGSAHPVYRWAGEALLQLRSAAREPVPGVGRHRAIQIWMPRLRGQRR